jgi:hypothetical protein
MTDNIVLRHPDVDCADAIVSHPDQPEPYRNRDGIWEWDGKAWQPFADENLRVYDLAEPA